MTFTFHKSPKLYNQHTLTRCPEQSSIQKGSVQCTVGAGKVHCLFVMHLIIVVVPEHYFYIGNCLRVTW